MDTLRSRDCKPGGGSASNQEGGGDTSSLAGVSSSDDVSFDEIAALMSELGDADPLFKAVLASTGQELAPLATDCDGRATLTSLRMSAGLTQVQLAQLVGQKQSNISLYESGARSDMKRETMRLFCTALGCDMNTLDSALENSVAMRSSAGDFRRA